MRSFRIIILFLILIAVITSCATGIRAIKKAPRRYINKIVTIRGKIIEVTPIPPTSLRILEIHDRKDKIYILTIKGVEKNRKKTFKGEIIPIKRPISEIEVVYILGKITMYLNKNDLASMQDSIKFAKKILEFLKKVVPEEEMTLLMMDSKIKWYLLLHS